AGERGTSRTWPLAPGGAAGRPFGLDVPGVGGGLVLLVGGPAEHRGSHEVVAAPHLVLLGEVGLPLPLRLLLTVAAPAHGAPSPQGGGAGGGGRVPADSTVGGRERSYLLGEVEGAVGAIGAVGRGERDAVAAAGRRHVGYPPAAGRAASARQGHPVEADIR